MLSFKAAAIKAASAPNANHMVVKPMVIPSAIVKTIARIVHMSVYENSNPVIRSLLYTFIVLQLHLINSQTA